MHKMKHFLVTNVESENFSISNKNEKEIIFNFVVNSFNI